MQTLPGEKRPYNRPHLVLPLLSLLLLQLSGTRVVGSRLEGVRRHAADFETRWAWESNLGLELVQGRYIAREAELQQTSVFKDPGQLVQSGDQLIAVDGDPVSALSISDMIQQNGRFILPIVEHTTGKLVRFMQIETFDPEHLTWRPRPSRSTTSHTPPQQEEDEEIRTTPAGPSEEEEEVAQRYSPLLAQRYRPLFLQTPSIDADDRMSWLKSVNDDALIEGTNA